MRNAETLTLRFGGLSLSLSLSLTSQNQRNITVSHMLQGCSPGKKTSGGKGVESLLHYDSVMYSLPLMMMVKQQQQ